MTKFGKLPEPLASSGAIADLRGSEAKTLLAIAAMSFDYQASVGMRRIAKLTGMHVGTVSKAVKRLEQLGILSVGHHDRGERNTYLIAESVRPQANTCSPHDEHFKARSVRPQANTCSPPDEHPENKSVRPQANGVFAPKRTQCTPPGEHVIDRSSKKGAKKKSSSPVSWSPDYSDGYAGTGFCNISEARVTKWAAAYPNADIDAELRKMDAWLDAEPKRRKSNYTRFITSWLGRATKVQPTQAEPEKPVVREVTPAEAVALLREGTLQGGAE